MQSFNRIYASLDLSNLQESLKFFNSNDLEKVKDKLFNLHKERIDLVCKSIKFSIQLMSKTVSLFENSDNNCMETLSKIKLFLKITRMVVENAKEQIKVGKGKENDFFTMYDNFLIYLGFLSIQKKFKGNS